MHETKHIKKSYTAELFCNVTNIKIHCKTVLNVTNMNLCNEPELIKSNITKLSISSQTYFKCHTDALMY